VDISNISACWELLEHSGSFDVGEEDQPLFELWWDLAQVSEELASRLTLSFGGIRYYFLLLHKPHLNLVTLTRRTG
jgi:hypothetical protein